MSTTYSHALPSAQEELPYSGADNTAYSMGQDFQVLANTVIYGVRVWNPGERSVVRNLRMYNTATSTIWQTLAAPNTLTPGWNEILLATPVTFVTGTTYTVSMNVQGALGGDATEHFNDYGAKGAYLVSNVDTGNIRMLASGGTFVSGFNVNTQFAGTFNNSYYGFDLLHTPVTVTASEAIKVQQASARSAASTSLAVTLPAAATAKNHIFIAVDCAATVNTPTGFTLIESNVATTGLYLFCKQAVGGETTVNVVPASNATTIAFMWEVRGLVDAAAASIKDGSANATSSITSNGGYANVTGATPSQADTYQVGLFGGQPGNSTMAADPGTTLGQLYGFTQLFDGAQSATPGNMLQVAARHNHATGAKGFTAAHGVSSGANNSLLTANFKVRPLFSETFDTSGALNRFLPSRFKTAWLNEVGAPAAVLGGNDNTDGWGSDVPGDVTVSAGKLSLESVMQNYGETKLLSEGLWDLTGTVEFDSNGSTNSEGSSVIYFTDRPYAFLSYDLDNANGPKPANGFAVFMRVPICRIWNNYNQIDWYQNANTITQDPGSANPPSGVVVNGTEQHWKIEIIAGKVYVTVAGTQATPAFNVPAGLPNPCWVHLAVHNHASVKYTSVESVFGYWDNLVYNAGSTARFANVAPGTPTQTGWHLETAGGTAPIVHNTSSLVKGSAVHAWLLFNIGTYSDQDFEATDTFDYRLNGRAYHHVNPIYAASLFHASFSLAIPVSTGEVVNGVNTIELTGTGFTNATLTRYANVQLVLDDLPGAVTLDPTTYGDGKVPGFTKFGGGFDLGKVQASVPDRFVVWDNGNYINYFNTATIWQTPISSRANHFISASLSGTCTLFYNAAIDGSIYNAIQVQTNGDLLTLQEGGGTLITNVGTPTNPYTLSVDASVIDHPVVKYNGVSVGAITTTYRAGSYVGIGVVNAATAGIIQIEPASGGATAPGAPTGVTPTAGNAQVALTWTAPASDGGSAITGYDVDWSSNGGTSWLGPVSTGSTATSYTKTGLTNATAYVFRVRAVNAFGSGSYSATSSSATPTAPATGAVGRMLEGTGARILQSASARYLEGAAGAAAAAFYSDNFDRADGALTTPWTTIEGVHSIASNKITVGTASPTTSYYNQTFAADQWAEADVDNELDGAGVIFPAVRIGTGSGADLYYFWVGAPGSRPYSINKRVGGVYTNIASAGGPMPTGPFKARLEVQGTTVRAYANGVLVATATDSSVATGRPGILSANGTGGTLDNFRCGDLPYVPLISSLGTADVSGSGTMVNAVTGINATAGKRLMVALTTQCRNNGAVSAMDYVVTDNIGDTGGSAWSRICVGNKGTAGAGGYSGTIEWWTRTVGTTPGASKTVTATGTWTTGGATTSDDRGIFVDVLQVDGTLTPRGKIAIPPTTTTATMSLTLDQTPLASSIVVTLAQAYDSGVTMTIPAGYTALHTSTHPYGGGMGQTAYKVGNVTNPVDWGVVNGERNFGAAVELA